MKTLSASVLLAITVAFFASCGSPQQKETSTSDKRKFKEIVIQGEAQGTTWTVRYLEDTTSYKAVMDSLLLRFDRDLSTWREGSLINRINAHDRTDTVFAFYDSTKYFSVVFDVSKEIYDQTDGAFDPTVYPLVELWGFGLSERENVTAEAVDAVLPKIGFEPANIDMIEMMRDVYYYEETHIRKGQKGVRLDFNAIAQGFSVDLMAEELELRDIHNYMIELGGEVLCKGVNADGQPWRIAIDKPKPEGEREFQAIVNVRNKAVATSGSYRKFYEVDGVRYSHTIDPRTGYPVQHTLLSATVMANDCGRADAFATAFMVMGLEEAKQFLALHPELELEAYLIYDDNGTFKTWMSQGMTAAVEEL